MSNMVFANNMEIACKASGGKSICAFPDVCFTPPQTQVTPQGVPIPYPNTGMANDTSDGSTTVQISGKEVMLKNKSYFKKSTGDEAGSAPKKGLMNGKNTGKVYFKAWSMNVKIEDENVTRHLDLMTHNHASENSNEAAPWPFISKADMAELANACSDEINAEKKACTDDFGKYKSAEECCEDPKCQNARQCMLVPYGGPGSPNCCDGKTGHHLLPNSLLQEKRGDSSTNVAGLKETYNVNEGACVCVAGESFNAEEHKLLHELTRDKLRQVMMHPNPERLDYETAKIKVCEAHEETFGHCRAKCTAAQIDASLAPHSETNPLNPEVRQKDGMTRKKFEYYKEGEKD